MILGIKKPAYNADGWAKIIWRVDLQLDDCGLLIP